MIRRIWLFVKDFVEEVQPAWDLARMRDCARYGGHRWGPKHRDPVMVLARTCSRCRVTEAVPLKPFVSTTNSSPTFTLVYPTQGRADD